MANSVGLTNAEALQRLYIDIEQVLQEHTETNYKSRWGLWWRYLRETFACGNANGMPSWPSMLVLAVAAFALLPSSAGAAVAVLCSMVAGALLGLYETHARHAELPRRVQALLCRIRTSGVLDNNDYPHLYLPYSPCITLQWTYRDGTLVNLPWALLVRGDVVLIRPGQLSPGHCQAVHQEIGEEYVSLALKEMYGPLPTSTSTQANKCKIHKPLANKCYRMLETPYLRNLRLALKEALKKPATRTDCLRRLVMERAIERVLLGVCLGLVLLVAVVQYVYFCHGDSSAIEQVFVTQPVHILLPLLPVVFPVVWILLNHWGVACLQTVFERTTTRVSPPHSPHPFEEDTDAVPAHHHVQHLLDLPTLRIVAKHFVSILFGTNGDILSRSTNVLHVLGTLTALCCVDKKGILSWPNPTAEKVFFLCNSNEKSGDDESIKTAGGLSDPGREERQNEFALNNNDCSTDTVAEVLDLTHEHSDPFKLHFDEPDWRRHIASLKPLGLAVLLNTCNVRTQAHYAQFSAHLTCAAMCHAHVIPVTNRRCLCELAKQIGFSDEALNIFRLQQQLFTFRHLEQPELLKRDTKLARSLQLCASARLKFPFPHMVAVVVREQGGGALQLLAQGTADIVLAACVDYWDGRDVRTLTPADRKRILDFYQRTSLTAYCTAFAYKPLSLGGDGLTSGSTDASSQLFLELPSHQEPTSVDSLLHGNDDGRSAAGTEYFLDVQTNQVFIGMVTMQYQAQTDMVHLIEQLERGCIRFVHFSKENELRSRVFSEKMGLESGWNCHISLLSDGVGDARRASGPAECYANCGTARVSSPRKRCCTTNSNLEQSRPFSSSAPSAINVEQRCNNVTAAKGVCDEMDSPTQDYWQSLSCLTDSTEQSAPVHFDMSNRAKLPRGIEEIRPHIEKIDNVPLLVSLFTDCTPTVIREMLRIMQDFGEVVCVICSSANADNMGICLQANVSVAVEPLYPQVCQKVRAHGPLAPALELSRQLNALACAFAVRREQPLSVYPLLVCARHSVRALWEAVQFWLCCCVALSVVQLANVLLAVGIVAFMSLPTPLPAFQAALLPTGQLLWLVMALVPTLSVSLAAVPLDPGVMRAPLSRAFQRPAQSSLELFAFVLWCYAAKFAPMFLLTTFTYAYMAFFTTNSQDPVTVASAQHLILFVIVLQFVTISASFVHRQHLFWQRSPHRNYAWLATASVLLLAHLVYAVHSIVVISRLEFALTCFIPFLNLFATEFIKSKEIKVSLRHQRRARLDFGTKLGMNSPF